MAKKVWQAAGDLAKDKISLGAALSLCAVAAAEHGDRNRLALKWTQELWQWASRTALPLDYLSYIPYLRVLEEHGQYECVDRLITQSKAAGWKPNFDLLGGLVHIAAEKYDQSRAEHLWMLMISDLGVTPNSLAYGAFIKSQLLAGKPRAVNNLIEKMREEGLEPCPKASQLHVTASLVLYHSSLARVDRKVLEASLQRFGPIARSTARSFRDVFTAQERVAMSLLQTRPKVRLHDILLVCAVAKRSEMAKWRNHLPGSKYVIA
eukprot:TRINITY_DN114217_c0_g1_i1.p1 TRINITY_DN114217_c0_g1~~TRINITY_DN114217_c0_g1_i1.p1  ORF type:complete len:297 (-),score=31.18 TRINITY_DN114217_c0_g1_i1:149-940(-)